MVNRQHRSVSAVLLASIAAVSVATTLAAAEQAKGKVTLYANFAKTDEMQEPELQQQIQTAFKQKLDEFDSAIAGSMRSEHKSVATNLRTHIQDELNGVISYFKAGQNGQYRDAPASRTAAQGGEQHVES